MPSIAYNSSIIAQIQDLNKYVQSVGDRRIVLLPDIIEQGRYATNPNHSWSDKSLQAFNGVLAAALTSTTGTAITLDAGTNKPLRIVAGKTVAELADERLLVTSVVTVTTNQTVVQVTRAYESTTTAATTTTGQGTAFRIILEEAAEGFDADRDDSTFAVTYNNYTQIFEKQLRLSGTLQSMDTVLSGGQKEGSIAAQQEEKVKEILLLQERACFEGNQSSGAANNIRKLGGLRWWANSVGNLFDQKGADLSLKTLDDYIEKILIAGADPGKLTIYMPLNQLMSLQRFKAQRVESGGFSGNERSIDNSWDMYQSAGGAEVKFKWSNQIRKDTIYILQQDKAKFIYLNDRALKPYDLAKTGDSDRKMLVSEATLEVHNAQQCLYVLSNLKTTKTY